MAARRSEASLLSLVPFLLFPALSAIGGKTVFGNALNPSLASHIDTQCAGQSYGCGILAFFGGALQPDSVPYTTHFLINVVPIPVIMLVESVRPGRSAWLSPLAATALGLLYQVASAAAILPLYWMIMVTFSKPSEPVEIDEAHAESITFATFVYLLITTYMVVTADPVVTLIWQFFPLVMLLAQQLHLLVRSPARVGPRSGRKTIQAAYGLCAVASMLAHLTMVWPIRHDMSAVRQAFMPRKLGSQEVVTLVEGVRNLLQWDGLFTWIAAMTASLWFARNQREAVTLALWNISTSITMGPGAALAMVYAWRENRAIFK